MEFIYMAIAILIISAFIAWSWINGIDDMMNNHPDYRGEDLIDEEPVFKRSLDATKNTDTSAPKK